MAQPARHLAEVREALSIKFNNLVYELQREGQDIIVLSLGEAFFDIPLHPFDELPFPASFHYSHSRGIPELRALLAAYYRDEYGVPVDPESEILVTAGSKAAIHMALMAVLDPGDEVIVHEPAWVSYVEQVKLCHANAVAVPYDVDIAEIEPYVTPRTKVVIVNYPNNPRGQMLTHGEWQHLHDLARRHDLYIVCDEAYSDFVPAGGRFVSCGLGDPDKDHSIICNSMSKNYGMSGWRVGYVMSNPAVISEILKINQHLITCPPTILSYYLAEHFHDLLEVTKPQIQTVLAKRREVRAYLYSKGLTCLPGDATFYLFVSIEDSALDSVAFCERLLRQQHVCVVPGVGYGESCDKFVRVSVGTESVERTKAGIDAIVDLVRSTVRRRSTATL